MAAMLPKDSVFERRKTHRFHQWISTAYELFLRQLFCLRRPADLLVTGDVR